MASQVLSSKTATRLVMVAGSAGSLDVIITLVPNLQPGEAAYCFVIHRNASYDSSLVNLLRDKTTLPVYEVEDKMPVSAGNIYIAPPDYHLLCEKETWALDYSEKVNHSRPSIDVAFECASECFKERLLCILLSGANEDGARGMEYARRHGAAICIQEPDEAQISIMPLSALQLMPDASVCRAADIAQQIQKFLKNEE